MRHGFAEIFAMPREPVGPASVLVALGWRAVPAVATIKKCRVFENQERLSTQVCQMVELGVNIDHVATVREARRTNEPDPVWAATLAQLGGADGITLHLREDRRHIQDRDLRILRETVTVKLNLELACNPDVLEIACQTKPDQATLVPERREEVTTEGGLLLVRQQTKVAAERSAACRTRGSRSACFWIPIRPPSTSPPSWGPTPSNCTPGNMLWPPTRPAQAAELARLVDAGKRIVAARLALHAGHGLTYRNVRPIATHRQHGRAEHRPQHRRPGDHGRVRASGPRDEKTRLVSSAVPNDFFRAPTALPHFRRRRDGRVEPRHAGQLQAGGRLSYDAPWLSRPAAPGGPGATLSEATQD